MKKSRSISSDRIVEIIFDYYGTTENKFYNDSSRYEAVNDIRRMICYQLNRYSRLSLSAIARKIGRKSHATVLNHLKKAELYMDSDQTFTEDAYKISQAIEEQMVTKIKIPFGRTFSIEKEDFVNDLMRRINFEEPGTTRQRIGTYYSDLFLT